MSVRANQTAYQPQEIAFQERKINLNPKVLNVVLNRKSWFQRNFAVRVHRTLNNNVLLQGAEPFLSNAFGLAEALRTVKSLSQIKRQVSISTKLEALMKKRDDFSTFQEEMWCQLEKIEGNDENAKLKKVCYNLCSFHDDLLDNAAMKLENYEKEIKTRSYSKTKETVLMIPEMLIGWLLHDNGATLSAMQNKFEVKIIVEPWSVQDECRRVRIRGHLENAKLVTYEIEKLLQFKLKSETHNFRQSHFKSKQKLKAEKMREFKQPRGLKDAYKFHAKRQQIFCDSSEAAFEHLKNVIPAPKHRLLRRPKFKRQKTAPRIPNALNKYENYGCNIKDAL